MKTEPALPAELIAGDSVDAVEASAEAARAMVTRVRTHIESQAHASAVPAGAPARSAPDVSMLTPGAEDPLRAGAAGIALPFLVTGHLATQATGDNTWH